MKHTLECLNMPPIRITPKDVFALSIALGCKSTTEFLLNYCQITTNTTVPQIYLKHNENGCYFIHYNFPTCTLSIKPTYCQKGKLLPENDDFSTDFAQIESVADLMIEGMEKESKRIEARKATQYYLYEKYTLSKPFYEQFQKNCLNLVKELDMLEKIKEDTF